MDNQGTVEVPSNISINGQEYSPEEAQQLIDLGSKTRELEKQWNTPVDKVWPEYGKLSQERSQWQTEKQRLEQQLSDFQSKQTKGVETPSDIAQARAAAKQLGIVLDDDLKTGEYVSKKDLDAYFEEKYAAKSQEQQAVESVLKEADKLAGEINATDTPAKFNKKAVLAYAGAYGITDLRKAYEEMNEDVLKPWKEAKLASARKPGLSTLKPQTGVKQPEERKPANEEEYKSLLKETLWGTDEGK